MTGAAVAGRTLAHDARSANVGAESKLTRWHARRPRLLENADSEFTHSQPPAREELREQSQLVWLPSGNQHSPAIYWLVSCLLRRSSVLINDREALRLSG